MPFLSQGASFSITSWAIAFSATLASSQLSLFHSLAMVEKPPKSWVAYFDLVMLISDLPSFCRQIVVLGKCMKNTTNY